MVPLQDVVPGDQQYKDQRAQYKPDKSESIKSSNESYPHDDRMNAGAPPHQHRTDKQIREGANNRVSD